MESTNILLTPNLKSTSLKIEELEKEKERRIKRKKYKAQIKSILSATSLQFILHPIRSKRILIKIFNICFLIVSLILSIYFISLNIIDYFKYETVTSIQTIHEKESTFPTISLCKLEEKNFELNLTQLSFNKENLKNEWKNHFELYHDYTYNKCYRFNSGKNMFNKTIPIKKSKRSGRQEGLYIDLYFNNKYKDNRLIIYIHNHTIMPLAIYNKGFYVSLGTYNYFVLSSIYDQKLEYPYNDCYKDISKFKLNKTIINYMIDFKKWSYSQKECENLCQNLKYNEMSNCSCKLKNIDNDDHNECRNNISEECYKNFIKNFNSDDKCADYCPLECDSFKYDTSIHTALKVIHFKLF
jgi:hypothetical protein